MDDVPKPPNLLLIAIFLVMVLLGGAFASRKLGTLALNLVGRNQLVAQVVGSGSSLVGRWNFEGQSCSGATVTDQSGNAVTLGVSGTTWKSSSFYEGACTMKWETSGANLSGGDVLDMGTSDRSVSLWFTADTAPFALVSKGNNASQPGRWYIAYCTGSTSAVCHSGVTGLVAGFQGATVDANTTPGVTTGSSSLLDGNGGSVNNGYHHAVAVWDRDGNLSLWVDGGINGQPQATLNITADALYTMNTASAFLLGKMADNSFPFGTTDHRLDDVRVYNRVLSASEITDLYKNTVQRYAGAPTGQLAAGTTQTTISLTTSANATCKYSTTPNISYASMANTFTTTGATSHSKLITGLTNNTSYNYYVRCNALNTVDYPISFSVATGDPNPPTVSLTSPAAGAVSGTVSITATASDDIGVVGVQFKLDGANLQTEDTSAPYSISWDATTATAGSHTLTATARDAGGNTTTSSGVSVTVPDTTAPTVSITAPATGTISGTVAITSSASDNVSVSGVQFKLDGANLQTEDTSAPYSISWDTTTVSLGSHTLTAVARDAAGNTTTSASVSVTVSSDAVAPTVSITSPTAGLTVSHLITITANASDNVSVSGVQFKLDGANLQAEDIMTPYSIPWDPTSVSSGSHTLTAVARDAAGNTTTSVVVSVTTSDVVLSGLVNRWKFNNDVIDNIGSVNGTLKNGATFGSGMMGGALSLDGNNDYVKLLSQPIENLSDETNFTISAWYYLDSLSMGEDTTGLKVFRENDAATPLSNVEIGVNRSFTGVPGAISFFDHPSPGLNGISVGPQSSPLGRWHLIVATRAGLAYRLYYDGLSQGVLNIGTNNSPNTTIACVGATCLTSSEANHFSGKIDDLRIYNRAISASEVTTLYGLTPPNSAPAVSISSPTSGTTFGPSDTVLINVTATDLDGSVSKIEFFDGNNKIGEDLTSPYSLSWSSVPAGAHSLTAKATDNDGEVAVSSAVSISLIDLPPTVYLTAPTDGSTVFGTLSVNANSADDLGVTGVQFKLDGANLQAEDLTAPYSISWNTIFAADGPHTLTAVARDAAGNVTTSAGVTVTVSNTAPVRSNGAPSGTLPAGTTETTISLTTDIPAVCTYSWNPNHAYPQYYTFNGSGTTNHTHVVPYGVDPSMPDFIDGGSYNYYVRCQRSVGPPTNTDDYVISFSIDTDTTAPTVSITAPTAGTVVSGTAVTVSANASDNIGVSGVQFKIDGLNLMAEDTTAPYSISWDTTGNTNGAHTLIAVARDAVGNTTTSAPVSVTVTNGGSGSVKTVLVDSTYGVMAGTNWSLDAGSSNASGATLTPVSAIQHTIHVTKLSGYGVTVDWCTYTSTECTMTTDVNYSAYDLSLSCVGSDCTALVTVPANSTIKLSFKYVVLPPALPRCAMGYRMRTLSVADIYATPSMSASIVGQQPQTSYTKIIVDPGTSLSSPYLAEGKWWCYGNFDTGVDGWVIDTYLIRVYAATYERL